MVEREADPQQQTAFEHTARHGRITDGAEQDRIVGAQFVEHRIGQYLAGGVIPPGTEVVLGLLDARARPRPAP